VVLPGSEKGTRSIESTIYEDIQTGATRTDAQTGQQRGIRAQY